MANEASTRRAMVDRGLSGWSRRDGGKSGRLVPRRRGPARLLRAPPRLSTLRRRRARVAPPRKAPALRGSNMLAPVGYEAPTPLPLLTRITRVAALGALGAASAGLAGWAWASRASLPSYTHDNSLGSHARLFVFLDMGIALA